jgi:CxxC motif-containing protein
MEQKELICIGCPLGCNLTVSMEGGSVVSVSGNTCRRGDDYARKEMTDPRRIVTSTVRVKGGAIPVVSVKTASDIPKNKIAECLVQLKDVEVSAPVAIGDVVLEDAAGTGVAVIATKNAAAI